MIKRIVASFKKDIDLQPWTFRVSAGIATLVFVAFIFIWVWASWVTYPKEPYSYCPTEKITNSTGYLGMTYEQASSSFLDKHGRYAAERGLNTLNAFIKDPKTYLTADEKELAALYSSYMPKFRDDFAASVQKCLELEKDEFEATQVSWVKYFLFSPVGYLLASAVLYLLLRYVLFGLFSWIIFGKQNGKQVKGGKKK